MQGIPNSNSSTSNANDLSSDTISQSEPHDGLAEGDGYSIEPGTQEYRGFTVDSIVHTAKAGDIHYSIHFPDSYSSDIETPLFITLPGYQGLYFQGVGQNLFTEEFAFAASAHDSELIVVAPQLSDWGERSADQTIALLEALMSAYSIDRNRVFIEGYSGGGETLSLVLEKRPDLFSAALHLASRWGGDLSALAGARVPVYMAVGESDEYYGRMPAEKAASELRYLYRSQGLSDAEVDSLVVLDVKPTEYFTNGGVRSQHGGGSHLFAHDESMMGWLLGR